jgi:hypothetical protein
MDSARGELIASREPCRGGKSAQPGHEPLGARGGWLHEVWYPGYSLCDTPDSWRPPGIEGDGSFAHAPLSAALQRLQAMEMGEGVWTRAERLVPGLRGFPTAAGFTRGNQLSASTVHPEQVAQVLAAAL